jgi:hypothetical protein
MQFGGFLMRWTSSWASVFYAFGVFGLFWLLFWFVLIYNHPSRHPFISGKEKSFLSRVIQTVDPDAVSIANHNDGESQRVPSVTVHTVPGQTVDTVEGNVHIGTGMGTDHRADRARLGFVHHHYRFAQIHEVRFEILGGRGT